MMFIELTSDMGVPIRINIAHIIAFYPCTVDNAKTEIATTADPIWVQESPVAVMAEIFSASRS